MEKNIFEQATRKNLRFSSTRGELTTSQLWDLPLTSEKGVSLNSVGTSIQRSLREMGEDNLVETAKTPDKALMTLRLDIVKHIIGVKQAEAVEATNAKAKKAEKQFLMEALERKQEAKVLDMSEDDLKARIAAL